MQQRGGYVSSAIISTIASSAFHNIHCRGAIRCSVEPFLTVSESGHALSKRQANAVIEYNRMTQPAFEYLDGHLELLFVQHLARRTLVSGVILRFLLFVAWTSSWRKACRYFPNSSSSR